jgi:oligoendopeptidase F
MRHANPDLRVRAYTELFRVFSGQSAVIGELYKTRVMDWKNEQLSLRKHRSPIGVRNMSNDLPDDVVNVVLKVCRKNAHIFQRYFAVKARLCGMKKMNRFHIYAPFRKTAKRYRYQDAAQMVLAAYRSFSPDLADRAEHVFRDNHIDAEMRQGKMGGAYCYSVLPGLTPYVMLNFHGDPRDVATLAHELGHAVHGMMAADQSVLSFHSTLPLAETASVFGERLLADFLLTKERNTAVRQQLLILQLDDLYATVLRQAFFTQFEMQAHRMIGEGATTTDLCGVYLADLREQFGKHVAVPDDFQWEWLTIPHFYHTPFYCYAYSVGTLLALALHRRYTQEGQAFVPRYLGLLAAGGSESPETILTTMGINMRSAAFWQSGFDAIADMVDTLEGTLS